MALVCLKCDNRISDEDTLVGSAQPDEGPPACKCGAKEWVYTPEPLKPYRLAKNDRDFLKSIRIKPED